MQNRSLKIVEGTISATQHTAHSTMRPFCMKEHADAGMRAPVAIIGDRWIHPCNLQDLFQHRSFHDGVTDLRKRWCNVDDKLYFFPPHLHLQELAGTIRLHATQETPPQRRSFLFTSIFPGFQ